MRVGRSARLLVALVLVALLHAAGVTDGLLRPVAAVAAGPLAGTVIAVDPGHNGGNASHPEEISRLIWTGTGWRPCATVGTTTVDGYTEHAFNWDVAVRVRSRLEALGATVVMTRSSDTGVGPCADERGRFGTEQGADLSLAIHGNGSATTHRGFFVMRPGYVEGYSDDIMSTSATLAASIRTGLLGAGIPIANYYATDGIRTRSDYATFNLSDIPVVMVELGNMKNPSDAARMKSATGRDRYAAGLVSGVELYLEQARAWSGPVARLAGADRYATAVAVSQATFPTPPVPVAYVATGQAFPDALAAGPAAAVEGGPVLLTRPDRLPAVTAAELARLRPAAIRVLGGPGAVSEAVVAALRAHTAGSVTRLAGADRYGTAAALLAGRFAGYVGAVYVAAGGGFPDALAGGAAAAAAGAPIALAGATEVPDPVLAALAGLSPTRFVLLGGTAVLGPGVVARLTARWPGVPVVRWAGADRYATAAAISAAGHPAGAGSVYLATGADFPDALAGVVAAGLADAPLLLTRHGCLPMPIAAELRRLDPDRVVLLGGSAVVPGSTIGTVCGTAL